MFLVYPLSARRGGCGGDEHAVTTRKPSLYPITNPNDQWCMVRAFVVGKAYVRHNVLHEITLVDFERLWRDENGEQSRQALALITAAGLSRDEGHTLDDLKTLQAYTLWSHSPGASPSLRRSPTMNAYGEMRGEVGTMCVSTWRTATMRSWVDRVSSSTPTPTVWIVARW